LQVPLLGGLPLGHGRAPLTVPLGATALLDTATKTLNLRRLVPVKRRGRRTPGGGGGRIVAGLGET
jgi:hypothetical protein